MFLLRWLKTRSYGPEQLLNKSASSLEHLIIVFEIGMQLGLQDASKLTLLIVIKQDLYEEIDVITKGGNYGWRVYEGPYLFTPTQTPGGNTSVKSISPIFPVLGYNHSEVNKKEGSASITGGYFYRSKTDPCMYGR